MANGATNGSRGYTAATKFDPDTTYDMLSIFPDLSVEAAIGRSYYFDALAPYTGTVPPEPLLVVGTTTSECVACPRLPVSTLRRAQRTITSIGFQGAEDHVSFAEDPGIHPTP